jgi:transcription elongation factor GreA
MSSKTIDKISHLINEEKWTRATIKSYSITNFKDLDLLIDEVMDEDNQQEIVEICEEHLHHTKNSIIALYISGIISLSKHMIDDSNLMILINIFSDNHKWNIVEYLCERILGFGENKFALRTLAESYENENEDEKKYIVWERLIKIDYDETEIVRHIAEKYEEDGESEKAVEFYKKAIHRYVNKKLFANVKELWAKLLELCPDDIDFFYHLNKKIAKNISTERASQLLEELYEYYKEREEWDTAIDILKNILVYDSKDSDTRSEIISCFKQKYSYHSQVEEYIRVSNLAQRWRNINEAISDFEKHISFDAGNYVFHRSWGIGRINSIKGDNVIIDFIKKRNHLMSLKMAVNALTMLGKEHIWVYKSTKKKDELRKLIKNDIAWALKTIIKSFGNAVDMKRIKSELVPGILTPGEWTTWSNEARKILKTDSDFGNLPDKVDFFVVRDTPITYEEKTFNKFKAENNFFAKIKTFQDFMDDISVESDYFPEMFIYFTNYLKSFSSVNEFVLSSYLIMEMVINRFPHMNPNMQIEFKDLFEEIEDLNGTFIKINDTDLKKMFLDHVKKDVENWQDIFVELFPVFLNKYIIDSLNKAGKKESIENLLMTIQEKYKDYREAFIWIYRNSEEYPFFESYFYDDEKVLVNMIHLLDITYREIINKRNVSPNKKINRQISIFLFKELRLENFLRDADRDTSIRMISLIDDVQGLDPGMVVDLKKLIKDKFSDISFIGEKEKIETFSRGGIIVTTTALDRKKLELKHILEVEIPINSKEIGVAIELGDLKENAEYKAGKEKQELLNISVGKFKEEIEKCKVFDPSNANTEKVTFGNVVELKDTESGEKESYTILGPWESSPEENIISYLAPFGNALLNAKSGDKLEFTINDRNYSYKVENIKIAEIFN